MNWKLYALIASIVIIAAAFVYFLFGGREENVPLDAEPTEEVLDSSSGIPIQFEKFPKGDLLSIGTPQGTVTLKNFYKEVKAQEGDTVLLQRTQNYEIAYDAADSSFWMRIIKQPIQEVRRKAEEDLLVLLGVDRKDACKLKVSWSPSREIDPKNSGKSFPLSFCSGGI